VSFYHIFVASVYAVYRAVFILQYWSILFFFFFQAEDGIRDDLVTGVQTCALPICVYANSRRTRRASSGRRGSSPSASRRRTAKRSEERRVGKECRSRGSTDH